MLIRFLHWVAKDVLPDKLWVRWLRWRYQRENRPKPQVSIYSATGAEIQAAIYNSRQAEARAKRVAYLRSQRPVEVEHDCGCPVARTADGTITRQYHDLTCEHSLFNRGLREVACILPQPNYNSGGVIRVDRHLIPHRPGRGICECAACNPSGAIFTC